MLFINYKWLVTGKVKVFSVKKNLNIVLISVVIANNNYYYATYL